MPILNKHEKYRKSNLEVSLFGKTVTHDMSVTKNPEMSKIGVRRTIRKPSSKCTLLRNQ